MIRDGLFERFPCDAVYGLHAIPGFGAGDFAITPGAMMAASDSFTARFRGTGGHGSAPDKGSDPSMALAHFMLGTQGIVGRNVSGLDSAVISIGHVAGGAWGSPNIIPAEFVVRGTVRSYRPAVRNLCSRLSSAVVPESFPATGRSLIDTTSTANVTSRLVSRPSVTLSVTVRCAVIGNSLLLT